MRTGPTIRTVVLGLAFLAAAGLSLPGAAAAKKWTYPEARKAELADDYHGTKVPDPYRWLEEPDSPETVAWVEAQNRLTRTFLDAIPARTRIEKRLTELWNYPRYGVPEKHGGRYFFTKNDGLQNQSVLYWMEGLKGEPRILIDPNKLREDGTADLRQRTFSRDGRLLAWGTSYSGSDYQEIRIRKVDTGEDYPEVLRWIKFAGVAWKKDNSGFFYNRLPEPGTVPKEDESRISKVYWHAVGTPQEKDRLIHEAPDRKDLLFTTGITEDGEYLIIFAFFGTDRRNGIYWRRTAEDGPFHHLLEPGEALLVPAGNVGTTFYFRTDLDAPHGRVVAVDINQPDRSRWREIIPERQDVLSGVSLIGGRLLVQSMRHAHERLEVFDLEGRKIRDVPLPAIGSVGGLSGHEDDPEMFFTFTSFLYPPTIYRYLLDQDRGEVFRSSEVDFDASQYVTRQVFFPSRDGTRVPMFLTHRKTLTFDGNNPVLMYGYGGFTISMTPGFSISRLVWLENGGIFAQVNLRGGNEYGEAWHRAGMLESKQNVFDDFITAAEYLIQNGYTSPAKLAIYGGSNGGLLTSACMVQRPDLFGAVVSAVPVADMLRYHRFTVGSYWVPEYGNAEKDPEHFRFLRAYSPLHNVAAGTAYPPTLVTTADTDDRVVPMHAKKLVATLQEKDAGENPILLRVETRAGHGAGKPTTKQISEQSDLWAFLVRTLGMEGAGRDTSGGGR